MATGGARHVELLLGVSIWLVVEVVALLKRVARRGRPARRLRATGIHWIALVIVIVVCVGWARLTPEAKERRQGEARRRRGRERKKDKGRRGKERQRRRVWVGGSARKGVTEGDRGAKAIATEMAAVNNARRETASRAEAQIDGSGVFQTSPGALETGLASPAQVNGEQSHRRIRFRLEPGVAEESRRADGQRGTERPPTAEMDGQCRSIIGRQAEIEWQGFVRGPSKDTTTGNAAVIKKEIAGLGSGMASTRGNE